MTDTPGTTPPGPDPNPVPGVGDSPPPPPAPAATTAPGWYPTPTGQRYWDGSNWTEHAAPVAAGAPSPSDEKTWAVIAHAGAIVVGFVAPLVVYLVKKDESPFIKHHATEGLNFAITQAIAYTVSIVLMIVLIGFILFPLVWIGGIVLQVMASMAANRGEWYRYPIALRLIN